MNASALDQFARFGRLAKPIRGEVPPFGSAADHMVEMHRVIGPTEMASRRLG